MTPLTLKYPEDWSGTEASNRISGEKHTVPRIKNKCYALDGGPFFTGSLVITVANTGKVLVRDVDYVPIFLYQEASIYAGQEICAAIAIINDEIDGELINDYNIIGGVYVSLVDALYQAIEALQLDDRTINWDDIKNKPELYPPEPHIHHVTAIYGTEHICMAIYALKQAMLLGNSAEMERVWDELGQLRKDMIAGDNAVTDLLYKHSNRIDNPHNVTKTQVGLSNVQNYGIANKAESEAGLAPDRYMTAQAVGWAIAKLGGDLVNAHANRTDNPHGVTKQQVNLGLVQNYGVATTQEAQEGVVTNKYMTPQLTKAAIDKIAGDVISAHTTDYANPHRVTQTQVGLSNVQNYGVASLQEAQAGVVQNKYMTPYLVKAAIDKIAGDSLNKHLVDYANPHRVTQTQVGLSNVQNYGIATTQEAQAASVSNKYMTPALVNASIQSLVPALVNAHANRTDNPHKTTATQVGLGSVVNMGIASDTQAQQDTNGAYLTPHSGRLTATAMMNSRMFSGAFASGNSFVYVDSGGGTRTGQSIQMYNNGALQATLVAASSVVSCNVNFSANNVQVRSDIRAKQKVQYFDSIPNESISPRLRAAASGVAYYALNMTPDEMEIGVIAQILQKAIPQAVVVDGETDLLSVKPGVLIASLLRGWFEHDRRLAKLEAKLA